uniref:Uncharacterized protein n=1 Tax=Oryza meridionalis TaxID=40149 RepID=A0A0E0FBT1_9ORYZ
MVVALIGGADRRTGSGQWERRTASGGATREEDSIRRRRLVDEARRPSLPSATAPIPAARFPLRTGLNVAAAWPVEDRPWSEQPLPEPCKQCRRRELEQLEAGTGATTVVHQDQAPSSPGARGAGGMAQGRRRMAGAAAH